MTRERSSTRGSEYVRRLISAAGFMCRAQRAVLNGLYTHADWETGRGVCVSFERVAEEIGYSREWVSRKARELEQMELLAIAERSKGGRRAGSVGKGHVIDIRIDRLEEMVAAYQQANREVGTDQPRTGARSTVNSVAINCEGSSRNQWVDQSRSQPPHHCRQTRPVSDGINDLAEGTGVVGVELLVTFGVGAKAARELGGSVALGIIRFGIAKVKQSKGCESRPAVLVNGLRDGSIEAEYQLYQARKMRQRGREMLERRTVQVDKLIGRLGEYRNCKDKRDEILEQERLVRSVWPTNAEIAAARVLTDEELREPRGRALDCLQKLAAAAEQHRARHRPARPASRIEATSPTLGRASCSRSDR